MLKLLKNNLSLGRQVQLQRDQVQQAPCNFFQRLAQGPVFRIRLEFRSWLELLLTSTKPYHLVLV